MKKAGGNAQVLFTALISLLFMGLLAPGFTGAEQTIEIQDLGQIKMDKSRLWSPGRLAIDGNGTLYVVDSYKNRIVMFDRSGNYQASMVAPQVSAVAAAADGTLYVGSHASYSVAIIRNGRIAGYLGKGADEFKSVRDIAVDSATGIIYVADTAGNVVRIFSASGSDMGSLGGVHLPVSIEISGSEIFVLDTPQLTRNMPMTTASRIAVFDRGLNLLRSIDEYGAEASLIRPTDIAVGDGIIYVTDAALKTVAAYDSYGTYLGEIPGAQGAVNLPVSIGLSSDGIMYVSSSETHSVKVFGVSINTGVRENSGVQGQ